MLSDKQAHLLGGTRRSGIACLGMALLLGLGAFSGCHTRPEQPGSVRYVTTIPPLGAILREVVGKRGEVDVLLPAGASPHTYEPSPADARRASGAIIVYVSPDIDAWAAQMPAKSHIAVIDLLPISYRRAFPATEEKDEHHGGTDPHFWTDPLAVKALLPTLTDKLGESDPKGAAVYKANATRFAAELQRLHDELTATLKPVRGQGVALFHPSFHYLLARYGITCSAVVEMSPGKEPTAQDVKRIITTLRNTHAKAIFTEPQLPRRPAQVIAEATGLPLGELDPLGGEPGRSSYTELLRYNAHVLRETVR